MTDATLAAGSQMPAESVDAPIDGATPAGAQSVQSFKGTKHKVKIDGKELDVDYDELLRDYQTREASSARMRQASQLVEQAKKERESWRKDAFGALKEHGHDPVKFAEDILLQKIEWEQLDPRERKAREAEHRAKTLEEQLGQVKSAEEARELQLAETAAHQELEADILGALKASGRKPTPRIVARLAETMLAHLDASQGAKRVTAADVLSGVQREYDLDLVDYLSELPVEQLRQVLPRKVLDALRKADVDQALSQTPTFETRREKSATPPPARRSKGMSTDSLFSQLDKKYGG